MILTVAFALAMDAFAAAVLIGMSVGSLKARNALRVALFFGGFQAVMPLAGWLAGRSLMEHVSGIDHWVAFGLLSAVGCKMIYESVWPGPVRTAAASPNTGRLLVLSVATSIDALVAGVSFAFLKVNIAAAAAIIGAVTFALSLGGVLVGSVFGHFFERKAEAAGGLVLIGMGISILWRHLASGTAG